MGSCFSKKKVSSSSTTAAPVKPPIQKNEAATVELEKPKIKIAKQKEEEISVLAVNKEKEEDSVLPKKEVFVIKHRKSHDRERPSPSPPQIAVAEIDNVVDVTANFSGGGGGGGGVGNGAVRTSSCTKEEVDAILIQCGRLSRSNSSGKAISSGRKYSGSKRSFDFDNPDNESDPAGADRELKRKDEENVEERRQHRQRHRQSPSKGRRRTPSREREQQQRSGSRERSSSTGNGRRVSRSPARRSENSQPTAPSSANNTANAGHRPGKMVSVPATVSIDKNNNGGAESGIKRITVKRNVSESAVAGSRSAASPRSRSPARANPRSPAKPSLSRSNSRKAEHSPYRRNPIGETDPSSRKTEISPYRRNPLSEIDPNKLQYPQSTSEINKKPNAEMKTKEQIQPALTRSRSARRSRDLDINPETLLNPVAPTSYTSLLLEDIQNFHQKSTVTAAAPPSFSLPACVSKACSIVEAVADLNSTTSSNLSIGRKPGEGKDPLVDLMEPSFHKYVTVKRGGDMEEQESSGSNSFVSSGQHWGYSNSSSSWEPNSAESTDRWSREEEGSRERNGIGRGRLTPVVAAARSR